MDQLYDPVDRGPHPVGVRTERYPSARSGRGELTVEIWYPTTPDWHGVDLDERRCDRYVVAAGLGPRFQHAIRGAQPARTDAPLVVFSHHSFGTRRESSHLMTHLASHGYVVAAVDHDGNTLVDRLRRGTPSASRDIMAEIREITERRSADLLELLERLQSLGPRAVAALGHSWGGYTALDVAARAARVTCVCAMAPGGSRTHLVTDCLREWLVVDWGRAVPTLIFASEHDSQIPCDGVVDLYHRLNDPKRLCILENCDHAHYVDQVADEHETMRRILQSLPAQTADIRRSLELLQPIESLRDPEQALIAVRAVTLAHLDAEMRGSARAGSWLGREALQLDAVKELAASSA